MGILFAANHCTNLLLNYEVGKYDCKVTENIELLNVFLWEIKNQYVRSIKFNEKKLDNMCGREKLKEKLQVWSQIVCVLVRVL